MRYVVVGLLGVIYLCWTFNSLKRIIKGEITSDDTDNSFIWFMTHLTVLFYTLLVLTVKYW